MLVTILMLMAQTPAPVTSVRQEPNGTWVYHHRDGGTLKHRDTHPVAQGHVLFAPDEIEKGGLRPVQKAGL